MQKETFISLHDGHYEKAGETRLFSLVNYSATSNRSFGNETILYVQARTTETSPPDSPDTVMPYQDSGSPYVPHYLCRCMFMRMRYVYKVQFFCSGFIPPPSLRLEAGEFSLFQVKAIQFFSAFQHFHHNLLVNSGFVHNGTFQCFFTSFRNISMAQTSCNSYYLGSINILFRITS